MKLLALVCFLCGLLQAHGATQLRVRGSQLIDQNGRVLQLKGINYFGFNNAQTMVDGLWAGKTSLTNDFSTQVYRQQLLGFNAVRLPFSFKDLQLPGREFKYCSTASLNDIRRSVTPPGVNTAGKTLPKPRAPLLARDGLCNIGMPSNTYQRFLWVINYYAKAGFVVVIDNHFFPEDDTASEDPNLWVQEWARLAAAINKDPVARGAVLYDLLNEPDNKKVFWFAEVGKPGLNSLYLRAMDAIYKVDRQAIFVLEGSGQIAYAVLPGDGFVTDPKVVASFKGKRFCTSRYCLTGIEDPSPFFKTLLTKPYAQSVVFGPHFYAQSVVPYKLPEQYMKGSGLIKRLSDSFGHLTKKGFCSGGKCVRWPVLIGEFAAPYPGKQSDVPTYSGLLDYMNNQGAGNDGRHEAVTNWFYWCWNDNSPDTNGGVVKSDWASIDWNKVAFMRRIGLRPWYTR